MTVRRVLAVVLALCHLVLVAFGAAEIIPVSDRHTVGEVIEDYRGLSGANNGYGFFAPAVASQIRARFTFTDKDGNSWDEGAPDSTNVEVKQRLTAIYDILVRPEMRQDVATSLAGTMLASRPTADRVVVHVEKYSLPTLADYHAGVRPRWILLYDAAFTKNPENPNSEE